MKKAMVFGLAAAMAGGAFAQNDVVMVESGSDQAQTEVTAEAALVSSYVWRGQVYNNDFVVQPQVTMETYGVSFNVWANYNLAGSDKNGTSSDFSEIDLTLAYTLPVNLDDVAFDVGIINYNYPANGKAGKTTPSTTELFGAATLLTFKDYVIPSFTLFGDIDEANGVYMLFDIVAPYQVSDYLAVEGGISAGYGNTSYNDYYFPTPGGPSTQDSGWNDYNFYANASYEILDNLSVAVNLTYTMLEGGSIRDAADKTYDSKEKLWGGVNLIYDF